MLDLGAGLATAVVVGTLPDAASMAASILSRAGGGLELTGVQAQIRHGRVERTRGDGAATADDGGPQQVALHGPTEELVGLRNRYDYSPTEAYEHIYLSPDFYTWHCLSGVEAGLADTDRCHHIRIAAKLYLFISREKIVPTLGVVLIDLKKLKTDGKIFGYDGFDTAHAANFPVGAVATILNRTP